ncbi:hypothetical protein IRJ41_009137 [Triplophysa rosa]|uniref:Ig-like domain-containing protein n=1 Tax=Triplophysa rosa TaxID=992332 RepID=A0A9W7WAL4_TRIRA|nr:hypothetical protein IRJ41_009137 [Triplophysa rosa]
MRSRQLSSRTPPFRHAPTCRHAHQCEHKQALARSLWESETGKTLRSLAPNCRGVRAFPVNQGSSRGHDTDALIILDELLLRCTKFIAGKFEMKVHMKNVKWIMVLFFLRAFGDVSCDGVMTVMDDIHIPNIPDPKISRDFPACKKVSSPKCLVACSVPSVARGQLSWYNENVSLSSLTVSDLVTRLYLEVEYHDKNNYSCVVSSSGKTKTSYLDVASSCQSCPKREIPEPASEGDSVILPTNLTEVQYEDHVMWLYENRLIAELFENVSACYDCQDKRFINRLQLDSQTGCLTVTNISKIHTGTIKLLITNGKHQECHRFNVTVYDPLPIPIITKDSTQCSSASKCVLLCSVLNVSDVTLSWYNGSRLNSSINVSDLKSNFLCLEVKYQDRNNYSCVVNNFFTNKTTPLNISEFCKGMTAV